MNCEIVIKISKSNLQVFYSQNKNSYKTFNYEGYENIPFYVFSDGNDFEIGEPAKIKFQNHFTNSFFNYFNLVKDAKSTFPFLDGEDKKMSFLLLYTIDKIIKELFKSLLIDDVISETRESVGLNLVFSSDITDVEINFLVNKFKDFGYDKCKFLNFSYLTLNYLNNNKKIGAFKDSNSNMGYFNGYVVIDAIDNNLQIDFYDSLNKKYPKLHEEGIELASDPKVKIIAKEMYKQAADATDSLTLEETELPHLIPLAQKYANTTKAEFRVEVVLTDGKSKKVKIKMRSINEKASYLSNFTKDFDLVKSIVKKSKLGNIDIAFVIKKSVVSQNFIDKLKSNYNNFYFSKDEFVDIIELFNSDINIINAGDFASKISKFTKPEKSPVSASPVKIPDLATTVKKPGTATPVKRDGLSIPVKRSGGPPPPLPPNKPTLVTPAKSIVGDKPTKRPGPPPPPPPPNKPTVVIPAKRLVGVKPTERPGPPPPPPPPRKSGGATPIKRTGGVKAINRPGGKPLPPPPPPPKP